MKIKLQIIRIVVLIATGIVALIPNKSKWAALWLHYYLGGRGGKLLVPTETVYEVLPSLLWLGEKTHNKIVYYETYTIYFHNTTYYEGFGFEGRPSLFYMIGCFTARVKQLNSNKISVLIKDVYDWHPSVRYTVSSDDTLYREYQEWMDDQEWSSIQVWYTCTFKFPTFIHRMLNYLLGDEYYPLEGFPSNLPGVSNKLWEDLKEVGAKPFTSIIKGIFNTEM